MLDKLPHQESELITELANLQQELAALRHQNQDLQIELETAIEHGDAVEATLQQTNQKLQAEIAERKLAQATLQDILEIVSRDKTDLELILKTATEHGDTIEYELYNQAVESMRQSEEQFRAIAESTPVAMLVSQVEDGAIRYANVTAGELLGPNAQSLVGHRLPDLFTDSSDADRLQTIFEQRGYVPNYELQLNRLDGTNVWVIASLRTISLQGDAIWLGTFHDITKRKQMEQALQESESRLREQAQMLEVLVEQRTEQLRRSEQKYRSIIENAVEGFAQITSDGRYLSVNPALVKLYGYLSTSDLMSHITNIGHQLYVEPQRWSELSAYLQHLESVSDFESQIYRKDGSKIWIAETIHTVRDETDDTLLYYEGTVRDITERKQNELELRIQRERAERLLLNVLPQRIAERLKREQGKIADHFGEVTVLFADIADFTTFAERVSPSELVDLLNQIFSAFDALVDRYRLEKIKTIGDSYMVVGGLPSPTPDHANLVADLALGMQQEITRFRREDGRPFQLRIGISTGPVVAGVIGTKKFIYDLWGDTVNVASRMESQGEVGRIQVTAETYECLKQTYHFEERGPILVKGKGEMSTYWLTGKKNASTESTTSAG